jgi:hypothetical protein
MREKKYLNIFVWCTAVGAIVPGILTLVVFPDFGENQLSGIIDVLIFPLLWIALVFGTVAYGGWSPKLWRLLWFSPLAFAVPLFLILFGLTFDAP